MKKFSTFLLLFASLCTIGFYTSCNKDDDMDDDTEVKSRFTPVQDANDSFTFSFTNESVNASSYAWDFGDGETSTETSPSHTYDAQGMYTVSMTATGAEGSHTSSEQVNVTDPNAAASTLAGSDSKTWKLLRQIDINTGLFPIQVGPADRSEIWWSYGGAAPLDSRPCLMEEEYIFHADGTYEYDTKGLVYAEGGVWAEEYDSECVDENDGAAMMGVNGDDLSAWGSGTHSYTFDPLGGTLTVIGVGAHIGLAKVGTDNEYLVPQPSVTYQVVSIVDSAVDTMVLETVLTDAGGYWQFVLVHYDDPADEPELEGSAPTVGFGFETDGNTVVFTSSSSNADTHDWDFGDGGSSSEENPIYTYSAEGTYDVTLTVTNDNGSNTLTQTVIISSATLTLSSLTNDASKIWKLNPAAGALAVGPGPGSTEWFVTTDEDVTSGRPCIFDDEYLFTSTGDYIFDTKGDVYGEPYMGIDPPGCVAEAALSADAAPWGSGNHTFTFTEATGSDPASLTVTGTGAFIGLQKAFNGGEYASAPPVANGSVTYEVLSYVNDGSSEIVVLTVDISEGEVGGAYWTFTLRAE
mgnify:CR=1 FL=1